MEKTQPSLAKSLRRAHAALSKNIDRLEAIVNSRGEAGVTVLGTRLEETRVHLAEHFRFEEQDGYMEEVQVRAPRFDREVQRLLAEHGQLAQTLDIFIEDIKAGGKVDDVFWERIQSWIKQLHQHESAENQLIEDAFNIDLGAED